MPRLNPTFTSSDIIRMWVNNLDMEERETVRCFFLIVELTKKKPDSSIQLILSLLGKLIPGFGNLFAFVSDILEIADQLSTVAECLQRARLKPEKP